MVIYALIDPRTNEVRYVGKANDVTARFRHHRGAYGRSHRSAWVKNLRKEGLIPTVVILETDPYDWQSAERKWIAYYREQGANLTNHTDGGEGYGSISPEHELIRRQKLSKALKGRKKSPEHVAKLPQNQKGHKMPDRVKRKISEALKGNQYAKGHVGVWKGKTLPDDVKKKISDTLKGHVQSKESRKKKSDSLKGRKKSPETIERMKQAALNRWKREKEKKDG